MKISPADRCTRRVFISLLKFKVQILRVFTSSAYICIRLSMKFDFILLTKHAPILKIMTSYILYWTSQDLSKMRYGIQIWTLWWLFKITHILVWFPLFHCICPMTWGAIILGNKVVAIYKKLKVSQLLIMRMSKYSPLLMLPLRWVKNPEPLFYMHPWQSHHHHQILLSVRQNCSCRPYYYFPLQTKILFR